MLVQPGVGVRRRQRLVLARLIIDEVELDMLVEQASQFRRSEDRAKSAHRGSRPAGRLGGSSCQRLAAGLSPDVRCPRPASFAGRRRSWADHRHRPLRRFRPAVSCRRHPVELVNRFADHGRAFRCGLPLQLFERRCADVVFRVVPGEVEVSSALLGELADLFDLGPDLLLVDATTNREAAHREVGLGPAAGRRNGTGGDEFGQLVSLLWRNLSRRAAAASPRFASPARIQATPT